MTAHGANPDQSQLVASLCDPAVYHHPVRDIRVVETHISYVILTGDVAYKIKKPVALSFLDFSTLEKRKFYCEQELSFNRRLSPDLYLGVVPITGTFEQPSISGPGGTIEYAVQMVQFDRNKELPFLVQQGEVDKGMIGTLAEEVADFHQRVERAAPEDEFGSCELVGRIIKDNFSEIAPCLADDDRLDDLESWVDDKLKALRGTLQNRHDGGFIRECHGDMHLGNMVLINDRIRLFDCLEFNEQLRWIDVMSEVAFLVMDLDYHGQKALAAHFLNCYLRVTGDYEGLGVLPLYLVYRAMVRAKVACIRERQTAQAKKATSDTIGHLTLACSYTRPKSNRLVIMRGVSGSGKSWIAERVASLMPAIHIRSDVERIRLDQEPGNEPAVRYSKQNIERVYQRLSSLAGVILEAGFAVVVDATFLERDQRDRFARLAGAANVPFTILDIHCPEQILRTRVQARLAKGEDPSEATLSVLEQQLKVIEPLSAGERKRSIPVSGGDTNLDIAALVKEWISP